MVFFDAHVFDAQMDMFHALVAQKVITDATVLALHDTNLHPKQGGPGSNFIAEAGGWEHQWVERRMANVFQEELGYDVFHLHTSMDEASIPRRHGVTVCQKRRRLLSLGGNAKDDDGTPTTAVMSGAAAADDGAACTGVQPLPKQCFRLLE